MTTQATYYVGPKAHPGDAGIWYDGRLYACESALPAEFGRAHVAQYRPGRVETAAQRGERLAAIDRIREAEAAHAEARAKAEAAGRAAADDATEAKRRAARG